MMRKWRITDMKIREWRRTLGSRRELEDEERNLSTNSI